MAVADDGSLGTSGRREDVVGDDEAAPEQAGDEYRYREDEDSAVSGPCRREERGSNRA